jgi:ABC-type sugar transport system permease subunit
MATSNVPKIMKQRPLVPWLYLLPSLVVMFIFIVYPMLNTIGLSFSNKDGTAPAETTCTANQPCWGRFENYRHASRMNLIFAPSGPFGLPFGARHSATT